MENFQSFRLALFRRMEEDFDTFASSLQHVLEKRSLEASEDKEFLLDITGAERGSNKRSISEWRAFAEKDPGLKEGAHDSNSPSLHTHDGSRACNAFKSDPCDSSISELDVIQESGLVHGEDGGNVEQKKSPPDVSVPCVEYMVLRETLKAREEQYDALKKEYADLERAYDLMRRQAGQFRKAYHQAKEKLLKHKLSIEYQKECRAAWDRIYGHPRPGGRKTNSVPSLRTQDSLDSPVLDESRRSEHTKPSESKRDKKFLQTTLDLPSTLVCDESLSLPPGESRGTSRSSALSGSNQKIASPFPAPEPWFLNLGGQDDRLRKSLVAVKGPDVENTDGPVVSNSSMHSSTQSTEQDGNGEAPDSEPRMDPSSALNDSPIFISARSLKRKRQKDQAPGIAFSVEGEAEAQDGSPERPLRIKRENQSSPVGPHTFPCLTTNETLDLDDVHGAVDTPRKQRYPQSLLYSGETNRPFDPLFSSGAQSSCDVPPQHWTPLGNQFNQALPVQSNVDLQTPGHISPSSAVQQLDRVDNAPLKVLKLDTEDQVLIARAPGQRQFPLQVLQPLDVNQHVLPRKSNSKFSQRTRKHDPSSFIKMLAEDGEFVRVGSSNDEKQNMESEPLLNPVDDAGQRIGALLERRSPHPIALPRLIHSFPSNRGILEKTQPNTSGNDPKSTPSGVGSLPTKILANERSSRQIIEPDGKVRRTQPLRRRSLDRLSIEDFKINPMRNQGLNYAFTEVVRGRDNRKCLPNCTRSECCGEKFHKVVKIGGAVQMSRGLWDSSQEEEDEKLLKKFLGDDYGRAKRMNKEDKEVTLNRARAQLFAANHGKHKLAHQRSSTPPGFWRTDMPTTQEREQDKEIAKEMEQRRIQERFEEAMRPNGLWQFRDE